MAEIETPEQYVNFILTRSVQACAKAIVEFPQPNYVGLKLAEEAGEVIKAAVHYAEDRETWGNVQAEVVQMIAMGLRLLLEGDQKAGIIPPHMKHQSGSPERSRCPGFGYCQVTEGASDAAKEAMDAFFEVYDRDEIISLENTEFDRPIDLMRAALKAIKERPA